MLIRAKGRIFSLDAGILSLRDFEDCCKLILWAGANEGYLTIAVYPSERTAEAALEEIWQAAAAGQKCYRLPEE